MGIKKVLKKVAKIGLPVGAAILAAKGLGNRSKKNWITKNNADVMNKRFAGKPHLDRFVEDKLTGDGRGMEEVAAKNRAAADMVRSVQNVYKKGGLVKKGKPKLAKRGWK